MVDVKNVKSRKECVMFCLDSCCRSSALLIEQRLNLIVVLLNMSTAPYATATVKSRLRIELAQQIKPPSPSLAPIRNQQRWSPEFGAGSTISRSFSASVGGNPGSKQES